MDLRAERAAVESALHRLRTAHFVGMECFGARSDGAAAVSLDEIDACDLYVGVIGLARGSGWRPFTGHRQSAVFRARCRGAIRR
jgi:hypothetical protein